MNVKKKKIKNECEEKEDKKRNELNKGHEREIRDNDQNIRGAP